MPFGGTDSREKFTGQIQSPSSGIDAAVQPVFAPDQRASTLPASFYAPPDASPLRQPDQIGNQMTQILQEERRADVQPQTKPDSKLAQYFQYMSDSEDVPPAITEVPRLSQILQPTSNAVESITEVPQEVSSEKIADVFSEMENAPVESASGAESIVEPASVQEAPQEVGAKRFKVGIVDISSAIESAARDRALEKMTQRVEDRPEVKSLKDVFSKKFAKHVFNMFWKNGIAREYYRQRDISLERNKIVTDKDLFDNPKAMEKVMSSTVDRFVTEYDEALHGEAGERREKIAADVEVSQGIKDLMESYLNGSIAETQFVEGKARIFSMVKGLDSTDEGLIFADNMLEVAKEMKELVKAGSSAKQLLQDFDVVVGAARLGVRTEAQFNIVDRLTKKISSGAIGSFVGPETISGALAIVYGVSENVLGGSLRAAARSLLGFGGNALVSGALAGAKESFRITEERMQHMRDLAKGKEFDPAKMQRRAELQPTVYETTDAAGSTKELKELLKKFDTDSWTQADAQVLMSKLSVVNSMISISDRTKRDLFSYSDEKNIEAERLQLDIVRAEAKVALKKISGRTEMLELLKGKDLETALENMTAVGGQSLMESDISPKDKLFRKLKAKRVGSAVIRGITTGVIIGGISQEIRAFFDPHLQGAAESFMRGNALQTGAKVLSPLEAFRTWMTGEMHVHTPLPEGMQMVAAANGEYVVRDAGGHILAEHIQVDSAGKISEASQKILEEKGVHVTAVVEKIAKAVAPKMHEQVIDGPLGNMTLKVPEGMQVFHNPSEHMLRILNNRGESIMTLPLDKDGHPTEEALRMLKNAGGSATDTLRYIFDESVMTTTRTGNVDEFVKSNPDLFHHVKRVLWFDNDTPGVYDKNELKLWWGGIRGKGLDGDGNIVMNMSHMTKDGSYHKGLSEDALRLAREGKLFLGLSASKGTQHEIIKIPVDQNGNFVIDKDSVVAKTLFEVKNGRVTFIGKFAEVSESLGKGAGDVENIRTYATHVGKGLEGKAFDIVDTVNHVERVQMQDWNITYSPAAAQGPDSIMKFLVQGVPKDQPITLPTEWPPFITLQLRTPLEKLRLRGEATESPQGAESLGVGSETGSAEAASGAVSAEAASEAANRLPANLSEVSPEAEAALSDAERQELAALRDKMEFTMDKFVKGNIDHFNQYGSERLKSDPNARLDHFQEIESYFGKQTPEYMDRVRRLAGQTEPMPADIKMSIMVPVAGDQEGGNIYQTLENYTRQTADPSTFELVLFVNTRVKKFQNGKFVPVNPDNTLAEIERFKKQYPKLNVRVINERLQPIEANLGFIRKMMSDAILYRHHARGAGAEDLIMVSNDADNKGLSPKYVEEFVNKFAENPNMDAAKGLLDWDIDELVKYPLIHVGIRMFQHTGMAEILRVFPGRKQPRNRNNNLSGANTAFRSSILAGIGGYMETSQGEDSSIGWKIVHARGIQSFEDQGKYRWTPEIATRWENQDRIGTSRLSRVYTSARRAVHRYYNEGVYPHQMWRNFQKNEEAIRQANAAGTRSGELPDFESVEYVNSLKQQLEGMISDYYKSTDINTIQKNLGYLGIRVVKEGDAIRITNMTTLLRGLKEYQLYGKALAEVKTGARTNVKDLLKAELEKIKDSGVNELSDELETFADEEERLQDVSDQFSELILEKTVEPGGVTRKIGDYSVYEGSNMSTNDSTTVLWAQKEGDPSSWYFVKEMPAQRMEVMAKQKQYPLRAGGLASKDDSRHLSMEELLRGRVNPDLVVLPVEAKIDGDVYRRVYLNEGISLTEYLKKNTMTAPQAVSAMVRGLQALGELHKNGLIHTDFQPSNILIDLDGKIKLADLEAAFYDQDGLGMISRNEAVWGFGGVMAPEMYEAGAFFDRSADTYSVGAVLYRLLTNEYPMSSTDDLKKMSPEDRKKAFAASYEKLYFPGTMDPKLKSVIVKALNPEPSKRYQTTAEMMQDLLEAYRALS